MTSWYHCDNGTGAILSAGMSSHDSDASKMIAPAGQTLFVVPDGLVVNPYAPAPDLSALKAVLFSSIDREAGEARKRFITDVPGQAQTYERKEREAESWTAEAEAANPSKFQFMRDEADVRGVSIQQVRAEILGQVNFLRPLASLIEAHRLAAKAALKAAVTLPAAMAAANIDWEGLLQSRMPQ